MTSSTYNFRRESLHTHGERRLFLALQQLRQRLEEILPALQKSVSELSKVHGSTPLGTVTIEQAIGGARSVPCMFWETSLLDERKVCVCVFGRHIVCRLCLLHRSHV
jgi:hypothetical protein